MPDYIIHGDTLTDIADAIRSKARTVATLYPEDMPTAIYEIETDPDLTDITITSNGTYTHAGYDGYDEVTVNVPSSAPDIDPITITENGTYTATGCDGYSPVTVNVSGGSIPQEYLDLVALINGTASGDITLPSTITTWNINNSGSYFIYSNANITSLTASFTDLSQRTGNYCISQNSNLTSVTLNSLTSGPSASYFISSNSKLASISLPLLTSISKNYYIYANNNSAVSPLSVTLPLLTTVSGNFAFQNNGSISQRTSFNFPALTSITGGTLFASSSTAGRYTQSITFGSQCDFGNNAIFKYLGNYAAYPCDIYLTNTDGICTWSATPYASYLSQYITFHVPASLLATYQADSNWQTALTNAKMVGDL